MHLTPRIRPCAIALLLCAATGRASAQSSEDVPDVRTGTTARRSIRPDQAAFTVQFTANGATPAEAGQHLAARADTVRRALIALGIPRDSLVTGSSWHWWPQRIQVVTAERLIPASPPSRGVQRAVDAIPTERGGWRYVPMLDTTYRAREVIEVRMGDIAQVGAAIDAILALGITEISQVRFTASDTHPVQLELLREATNRAAEQAEAIASANGGRLGRVLYLGIQSPAAYSDPYGFSLRGYVAADVETAAAAPTEVTAPAVVVSVTVFGRWQLLRR